MRGKLKSLVGPKGFGFILAGKQEYFFHRDDLVDKNQWDWIISRYNDKEDTVEFEFNPVQGKKGPRAANVEVL